jgi:hypothetical protein
MKVEKTNVTPKKTIALLQNKTKKHQKFPPDVTNFKLQKTQLH